MVSSKLDSSVEYPEIKKLNSVDEGFDASLYEVELYNSLECVIAVGNINNIHKDKGLYYMSVYLVVNESMGDQIGIYECLESNYTNLLDDDNDLDLDKLDNPIPLLFSFVTPDYLRRTLKLKKTANVTVDEPLYSVDEPLYSVDDPLSSVGEPLSSVDEPFSGDGLNFDDLVQQDNNDVIESIEIKMMEESIEERKNYKKKGSHKWIQKFMRNKKFGINDVEAQGDCFFAVIREAFKGINKNITVQQIRYELSKRLTPEIYEGYKHQYDMYSQSIQDSNKRMVEIHKKISELKAQNQKEKNPKIKKGIIDESKPLIIEFQKVKRERKNAIEISTDFQFMKKIKTIDDFKKKIQTCSFWADIWSINLIEMFLNIKVIILSSEKYNDGDIDNVLLCSSFIDDSIKVFRPKYYILVDHNGNHYKLITYNGKRIFTFETIPYDIKQMIIDKCMEKQAGIFNLIPKFIKLKSKNGHVPQDTKDTKETMVDVHYDENTTFQFYSKSSSKPLPGKGAGEKIQTKDIPLYQELQSISDWRKVLSNFWLGQFNLDGHKWSSVEHFYHASKFKKNNPEFYLTFTLDTGGGELSKNTAMAKGAGGKTGKFQGKKIRPKTITMDPDFFTSKRNELEMERGQQAKYEQNPLATRVLLATGTAKLQHFVRASEPIIFYDTMRIREKLRKNKKKI